MTFDVKLGVKELYGFTIYKFYSGFVGTLWLVFSIFCLGYAAYSFGSISITGTITLVFIGLLFTVIQPIWLYTKVLSRVKKTPQYQKPFTYTLTKKGFHITQGEASAQVKWSELFQIIVRKNVIYLCTGPSLAQIIPLSQLDENTVNEVKETLKKYAGNVRRKGRL